MADTNKQTVLRRLMTLPGVGASIADDLYGIGVRAPEELRGADPEALYERICARQKARIDRCLLYVMRCAVHYASTETRDPELLKWWNWKD
ncbi:MAG TPA: helix-hairpin-helix domain-containing protein [Spirochaetota bacterium]|nr:helix-hairpin-helix domain-containing protein [Spirochaetota bacterium]